MEDAEFAGGLVAEHPAAAAVGELEVAAVGGERDGAGTAAGGAGFSCGGFGGHVVCARFCVRFPERVETLAGFGPGEE